MDEDHERMLYVRLPHTIHNMDEIRDLFTGDIQIKLPRQSSRHCHVTFASVEEKIKNLKEVRKKIINNKRVIARIPRKKEQIRKKIEKKTVVPEPKPEQKITRILYVMNINTKTTTATMKKALSSCRSVTFFERDGKPVKQAIVRFNDPNVPVEYLKKERPWPVVDGNQLIIKPDTRKQKKKKPELKIWDGDVEITNEIKFEGNDTKQDEKSNKIKVDCEKKLNNKKKKNNKKISGSSTPGRKNKEK